MIAPAEVLEVLHELRSLHVRTQGAAMSAHDGSLARIDASIAAVTELIEAVSDVYGDEVNAGRGTCSPDCMSCRIQTALARVQGDTP